VENTFHFDIAVDVTMRQAAAADPRYLSEVVSELVTAAVESDYWDRCGASADNTSAVLLQFTFPPR